jgi:hypothetical protein
MLKKIIFACLSFLSTLSLASPAYISHKIINNTNTNLDVLLRQIYVLPLDGCMGSIPAHSTKECSGSFDNNYPFFIFDVLRLTDVKLDTEFTVKASSFSEHQSVFLTWTLEEKEPGKVTLNLNYHF